jgi:hypothetical protein
MDLIACDSPHFVRLETRWSLSAGNHFFPGQLLEKAISLLLS